MTNQEIIKKVLKAGLTQSELAKYLEVTRQTVSKIENGIYVRLNDQSNFKMKTLQDRDQSEYKQLFEIDQHIDEIKEVVLNKKTDQYTRSAHAGFKYMNYWFADDKFIRNPRFHIYYFGHLNNFYPRINQAYLFMKGEFNRETYPLLTFQVDYDNKEITDFALTSFLGDDNNHYNNNYNNNGLKLPCSFTDFSIYINNQLSRENRFLIYADKVDDDFKYIIDNDKKTSFNMNEVFDLSRLFNHLEQEDIEYGPLIEDVLSNFNISYDIIRLLNDCRYRAKKIIEVVNIVSLKKIVEKSSTEKIEKIFERPSATRIVNYSRDLRRNKKRNSDNE